MFWAKDGQALLARNEMTQKKRLGEILYERGQISAADLEKALLEQGKIIRLGELLLQRKLVSKKELAAALWEISGVEHL
jgi:hypothetical protein